MLKPVNSAEDAHQKPAGLERVPGVPRIGGRKGGWHLASTSPGTSPGRKSAGTSPVADEAVAGDPH